MNIATKLLHLSAVSALGVTLCSAAPALAEELSKTELAKLAQNPVANLISVPLENDFNFNAGPNKGLLNVLKLEPVIPFSINQDWNVITRTIVPLVSTPSLGPTVDAVTGLGDLQFSTFLSPATPGAFIWGVGSIVQAPTHTSRVLGNDNLGLGPSAVALHLEKGSPWVYGALINNVWSVGTSPSAPAYSNGLLEPFINYNFGDGWYLQTEPLITMNWLATSGQQLTLPLGGGIGKIFHFGKLPVNTRIEAYYNVVRPDYGPQWQLRLQVQAMFPK